MTSNTFIDTFINVNTLDYPRHAGDIALDPEGTYAQVIWTDPPEIDLATQRYDQLTPEEIDGKWYVKWITRSATQDDLTPPADTDPPYLNPGIPGHS